MTTTDRRRRRPHPAQRARVVTAGLAATAVLGITAALGLARGVATGTPAGGGVPGGAPAVGPGAPAPPDPGTLDAGAATPTATVPVGPPDATTHGSR
ncbi:MAG TPA: hypothetical protein VFW63_06065 [Acidimicrobiales bacterium]|nr:hypothetical protein [Acidimicrobiales bacterium]